jgi:hypothetical protein
MGALLAQCLRDIAAGEKPRTAAAQIAVPDRYFNSTPPVRALLRSGTIRMNLWAGVPVI